MSIQTLKGAPILGQPRKKGLRKWDGGSKLALMIIQGSEFKLSALAPEAAGPSSFTENEKYIPIVA